MGAGTAERQGLSPVAVINIVLFSLTINIYIMAIGFAIISGIAYVQGLVGIPTLFAAAAGFLGLLGSFVVVIRSGLVSLINDLAFE